MTRHDIDSPWLGGPRRVTVWTPEPRPHGTPAPRTSCLILHDGQNLFEPDRAHRPGHHWRVAETLSALTEAGLLPPLVVAGIDHAEQDRLRELTPSDGGRDGGDAWRYGRFVMEDLLPVLVREFDIDTRPGALATGGSSLGGLVTLALAQQYPGRFGRLLVMSPSVWWDESLILKRLRRSPLVPNTRVWLDIGHQEGREALQNVRRLRRVLRDQLDAGQLGGTEEAQGDHSEDSWARRLPDALTWLYRDDADTRGG